MKEETIKQAFNYLDNNYSSLYLPSSYQKRKNFICQIKNDYWFLIIQFNMFSFVKENPVSQTREEFKFNSARQLKVAINKAQDIEKVIACIISRINYIKFLHNNNFRDKGTNLAKVFSKINDYYVENTCLYQNLIEEKTITFDRESPIFAPLQSSRMVLRPELRQSNYMTREQIEELFRDRVRDSVNELVSQTQRTITLNSNLTLNAIREAVNSLSERVEAMRAERNNNE